jgi:hypothetical protein
MQIAQEELIAGRKTAVSRDQVHAAQAQIKH